MERRSHKAVTKIQCLAVAAGIGVITISSYLSGTQVYLMKLLKQELMGIHPELRKELQNDFAYYEKMLHKTFVASVGLCILGILVIAALGAFLLYQKKAAARKKMQQNMECLIQVLMNYQKGNYNPDQLAFNDQCLMQPYWSKVENCLRALGYQLRELKESLANEEKSIKGLVTDISHQLKTPLAAIRINHELARDTALSAAEQEEFILQEEQGIERLEQLMNELVNVSRLESNMIRVEPKKGMIRQLIGTAVAIVLSKAEQKHIQMVVQCEQDIAVRYDRKWMPEAIANLLDNAVKYSPEHSTITITAHRLPTVAMIEIEDEGIGIKKQDLHKIYHRFYRGEQAKEMDHTGAGVGLYLTRWILEQQGGTITAKRKQKGTRFIVSLPI